MRAILLSWVGLAAFAGAYDVRGQLVPAVQASVSLHGATSPFQASTLSDSAGKFRFKKIQAGTYMLIVFVPGSGETRKTIDIGPAAAGKDGRVDLAVKLDEAKMTPDRSAVVSMRDLSIPDSARNAYRDADKRLGQRDIEGAIAHLKRAVAIAPQFAAAWNHLGTISYQTRRYAEAEEYFRKALEADPDAYEPLVNLGGVLVTLDRPSEAWSFNLNAVLRRPNDALAQSQLGMTYFGLGKLDLAERYLLEARRLDAGHFSHPQLLLAEIYLRRNLKSKAAEQLEDFLKHHPDWPQMEQMRSAISKLRGSPGI